jgi:glutaredoxin
MIRDTHMHYKYSNIIRTIGGIILLICLSASLTGADMYKWVDAKGVIHFADQPPPKVQSTTHIETLPSASPGPTPPVSASPSPPPVNEKYEPSHHSVPPKTKPKSNDVILYVTSWCKYCKKAKAFLRSRKIAFTEYDIEKDHQAAQRRKELDPRSGVPLAVINGHVLLGFSEASYMKALNLE